MKIILCLLTILLASTTWCFAQKSVTIATADFASASKVSEKEVLISVPVTLDIEKLNQEKASLEKELARFSERYGQITANIQTKLASVNAQIAEVNKVLGIEVEGKTEVVTTVEKP